MTTERKDRLPSSEPAAVVVLANDPVHDWLVAFLGSFRKHNPDMALKVLPYDRRIDRISRLAAPYAFELIDYDFGALDDFARELYPLNPKRRRRVRKFAALDLPLKTVIYVDVDTVVLHDFAPLTRTLVDGRVEFVYGSTTPGFVFKPHYQEVPQLSDAVLFSDGFFVTANRFISSQMIIDTVRTNLETFRRLKQPRVFSQPLVNFTVYMRGIKAAAIDDVTEDLSSETYYKGVGITHDGTLYRDKHDRKMLIMHWAGSAKLKDDDRFRGLWEEHFDAQRARR